MKAKFIGDPAILVPCEYQGTESYPGDYCKTCEGAIRMLCSKGCMCPIMGKDREVNERFRGLFEVEE